MTRDELIRHHNELCDKARNIMIRKNNDYTGGGNNSPFANFERTELMDVCSTEQGFLVRIIDKISRLSTFVKNGTLEVQNEGYEDAILDILNYLVLLSAYVSDRDAREPEFRDRDSTDESPIESDFDPRNGFNFNSPEWKKWEANNGQ